ncbi:MAG: hypothetical protein AAF573_14460 [Bacteroidota bacterium]
MKTLSIHLEKNNKHHFAIRVVITILSFWLLVANTTVAQNSWLGGTPGAETEWNNPKNWSENRVPDWRDDVVIIGNVSSQSGHFPKVTEKTPEISHLRLDGGATLTIEKEGSLIVNGANTHNYGIVNVGTLVNYGFVSIENTALPALENLENRIINRGAIALIDYTHNTTYLATTEDF